MRGYKGMNLSQEYIELGIVGVDSGQLLIIDPCYIGQTIPVETIQKASHDLAVSGDRSCGVREPGMYVDLGLLFRVPMDGEYTVELVTRVDGVKEIRIELGEE